ncbi:ubiquitin family protein [Achlya hypogyna]|uniref:Ubiquitin family protein n=1 Tax=Achlya hypogyna TaxID=1202772 RepID=A0A1V9ZMX8_ACHHY|nr:ubiquitin family protein [Achlya hypogyna]
MESAGDMEIRVKTLNDHSFALTVARTIGVTELKAMLLPATQVPEARQRLIYRGKLLKDGDLLSAYNIENGHTLHMVAKPDRIVAFEPDETEPLLAPTRNVTRTRLQPRRLDSAAAFASMRRRLGLDDGGSLLANTSPTATSQAPPSEPPGGTVSDRDPIPDVFAEPEPESIPPPTNDSLEHLTQGLMTIRTLLSTASAPTETVPAPDRGAVLRSRREFFVGQWLDVKDTVNQWLEGTVLEVSASHVHIHYHGWPTRWDEWIEKPSPRLAAFRTRTLHTSASPFLSPTPAVRQPRAPTTTVRALVPQIRDSLHAMLPFVDHLAALCEAPDDTPSADAVDMVGPLFDRVGRILADAAGLLESLNNSRLADGAGGHPTSVSRICAYESPRGASGQATGLGFQRWAPRGQSTDDATFRELIAVSNSATEPPAVRRNIDVHIHAILASPPPTVHRELLESETRWRELTERMQASLQRSLLSPGVETSMPLHEPTSLLRQHALQRRPYIGVPSAIPEIAAAGRRGLYQSPTFLDVLRRTMQSLPGSGPDAAIARSLFEELPLFMTDDQ